MNATNGHILFVGEVSSVTVRGKVLKSKCATVGMALDRKVPRLLVQPSCNHTVFTAPCGLSASGWRFSAIISNPGVAGWPFEFQVGTITRGSAPRPVLAENWFAGGWIELYSGGSHWQRRAILRSTAESGGHVTLTLDRDPDPFPATNDPVTVYPGCDGIRETCQDKFQNYANFGGFPFVPVGNPSMVKVSANVGGGKK